MKNRYLFILLFLFLSGFESFGEGYEYIVIKRLQKLYTTKSDTTRILLYETENISESTVNQINQKLIDFSAKYESELNLVTVNYFDNEEISESEIIEKSQTGFQSIKTSLATPQLVIIINKIELYEGNDENGNPKIKVDYIATLAYKNGSQQLNNCLIEFPIIEFDYGATVAEKENDYIRLVDDIIQYLESCFNDFTASKNTVPDEYSNVFQDKVSAKIPDFDKSKTSSDSRLVDYAGLPETEKNGLLRVIGEMDNLGVQAGIVVTSSSSDVSLSDIEGRFNNLEPLDPGTEFAVWFHYDQITKQLYYKTRYSEDYLKVKAGYVGSSADLTFVMDEAMKTVMRDESAFNENFNPETETVGFFERMTWVGKVGKETWKNSALPEGVWHKGFKENGVSYKINFYSFPSGAVDYGIEELKSIPDMLSMAWDLLDKQERQKIFDAISSINLETIKKMFQAKVDKYQNGGDVAWHEGGKDLTMLAHTFFGGALLKSGKTASDVVEAGVDQVKKSIDDIFKEISEELAKKIDELPEELKDQLKKELSEDPDGMLKKFDKDPKLVKAWREISEAIGTGTKFAKDFKTISRVNDILNDSKVLQKFGGEDGLKALLKKYSDVPCEACGNLGRKEFPKMDQILENTSYFIKKYSDKVEGADKVLNEVKNGAVNARDGVQHALKSLKEMDLPVEKLKKFDGEFEGDGIVCTKCRFDVELKTGKPKLIEYKSWSLKNIPNISKKQLIEYFRSATSIEDIKYVFNSLKTPDVNSIKAQMKNVLSDNIEDIFEAMPSNFRKYLLGAGKGDRLDLFEDLVDDPSSKLYDFIEVK